MSLYTDKELKNDQGVMYTKGLFYETSTDPTTVIFTLKINDHAGYRSLRQLYLENVVDDPTEYKFAIAVFGDVTYWNRLQRAPFLQDHITEWRRAADVERKSVAFSAIVDEVKSKGRNALSAAKYLIEEPWKGRGKEVRKASKETSNQAIDLFKEDLERLKEHWQD